MKAPVRLAIVFFICFLSFSSYQQANASTVEEEIAKYFPQVPPSERHYFAQLLKLSFEEWNNTQSTSQDIQAFDCQVYPPQVPPPTSVNRLRPADISFIGAIGDSLSAAFGARATSLLNLFNDWRGTSFSVGGDDNVDVVLTVANIVRRFNPRVVGFSTGRGNVDSAGAGLNVAITGARFQGLNEQVDKLVARLKAYPNFNDGWKIVSVLIGANNLCDICEDWEANSADAFAAALERVLDRLQAEIPRLFVNLMTIIDVTELNEVTTGLCGLLHDIECKCAVSKDEKVREAVSQASRAYNAKIQEIAQRPKYNNDDQFTVVVQPWFQDTIVPRLSNGRPDTSFFAPDCFHFSAKGHASAATGLWNNMVEKVGAKKTSWVPGEPIECPEENEFLYTHANS